MRKAGPGRPRGVKYTKMSNAEVQVFLKESMKVIFNEHMSHTKYIEWCKKQSISRKQANQYWVRIWDEVGEKFRHERDKLVNKHLLHYWDLYDAARNEKDLSNARQVLDAIAKLMGLNEPDKVDMKNQSVIEFKFGDEPQTEE